MGRLLGRNGEVPLFPAVRIPLASEGVLHFEIPSLGLLLIKLAVI